MKKTIAYMAALVFTSLLATSQEDTTAIKRFLEKVQQAYSQAILLDCKVQYRYANKNQPNLYLDSMAGAMTIDKNRVRFVIDGTETITTDKYNIYIANDEKVIHVSKASAATKMDPVSMAGMILTNMKDVITQITRHNNQCTLSMQFKPGQLYSRVVMTMNEQTGLLQRVTCDVRAASLVSEEQLSQEGRQGIYQPEGRIEIIFSDYRQGQASSSLFDESFYFTRQGNHFEPAAPFKDYRIFIASLNL